MALALTSSRRHRATIAAVTYAPPVAGDTQDVDTAAAPALDVQEAKLRRQLRRMTQFMAVIGLFLLLVPAGAWAKPVPAETNNMIMLALYLGALSLLPFAVMTLTSFLRIVVVLSFLRSGLGAQNVPPNIVIIALSLFLSLFVMGPTLEKINQEALQPYQNSANPDFGAAFNKAQAPLKDFMLKQLSANSKKEVSTFHKLAAKQEGSIECRDVDPKPVPEGCLPTRDQIANKDTRKAAMLGLPIRVIIPAFIISELKKAFIMGFAVLLPFLVIDMVISNILLSLGMFMLPPVVISLPFKILLFVITGGWTLVVENLVKGFVV